LTRPAEYVFSRHVQDAVAKIHEQKSQAQKLAS
jgi:hypothetical protein